jgi:hypothetical protein
MVPALQGRNVRGFKMLGYDQWGRIVRGLNIWGFNIRGRIVLYQISW